MGFNAPLASQSRSNQEGDAIASQPHIIHEIDRFECVGTPRVSGASVETLRRPSRKSRLRLVVSRQAEAMSESIVSRISQVRQNALARKGDFHGSSGHC